MKLFILAAGKGERLWPLTKNTPKSLIDFGDGTTILERQIESAVSSEMFSEIIIITGYKTDQIEAKIKDHKSKINIKTIFNPVYNVTNNLVSLWVAHNEMQGEDFVITNGDNIYIGDVFMKIKAEAKNIIQLTIDYKDEYQEDDMKVSFGSDGLIMRVHKDIPLAEVGAESVGLVLVKGEKSRRLFVNKILQLVKNEDYLNKFWLEIFNSLIDDGIVISFLKIEPSDWNEVDFHPDVDIMKAMIFKETPK